MNAQDDQTPMESQASEQPVSMQPAPLRKPPSWDHSPRSEATSYDAIAKGMSRELRDTDVPDVYVIEREAHQLLKSQEPSIVTDDEIAGFPFVLCDSPSHAKELLAQLRNDGKRVALICR